jgi:hypothetical protein
VAGAVIIIGIPLFAAVSLAGIIFVITGRAARGTGRG